MATTNASQRAAALADQYEQVIRDIKNTVEQASDAQWRATCGAEGWTVAATAQHVGDQLPLEMEYIVAAAEGKQMPTYTWDDINGLNEKRAEAQSACDRTEVLRLLRENGSMAANYVRGLSEQQLDRTASLPLAGGATVTTQQLIEGGVLIEHATSHLASIRAAK